MAQNFLDKEKIDTKFVFITMEYLNKIQQKKWSISQLELLKLKNIQQLIVILDEFKPKSLIREEKRMICTYLDKLIKLTPADVSKHDILLLRKQYIIPILNYKLDKYGYRIAGAWLYSILFIIPIDIAIFYFLDKIIFFIPVFSLIALIEGLRKDYKAKKRHRLW